MVENWIDRDWIKYEHRRYMIKNSQTFQNNLKILKKKEKLIEQYRITII